MIGSLKNPSIGRSYTLLGDKLLIICNGNRTEWSPIQSVMIRVITKSDDCVAGVRFVYHEYDYRLNWTNTKSHYQLIIKITISEKKKKSEVMKKGEIRILNTDKGGVNISKVKDKNTKATARAQAHVITTLNVIG